MKIDTDVLAVLSTATLDGNSLVLVGQLDRRLYEKTNKVLEAAGGKWNRKAKAHVFDTPANDRLEQILLSGAVEVPKDDFEFFPTPPDLAHYLVSLAHIEPGERALEPSAGQGAIAAVMVEAGAEVDCYELMGANAEALAAAGMRVRQVDFLAVEPQPLYSVIVMNPPFSRGRDIQHVLHAHRFLQPGGRLVAVMAAGASFRQDRRAVAFREAVLRLGGEMCPLPEDSFKASGTGVNTLVALLPAGDL